MKTLTKSLILLLALIGISTIITIALVGGPKPLATALINAASQKDLSKVDRIEIYLLTNPNNTKPLAEFEAYDGYEPTPYYAQKTITGPEANDIAIAWQETPKSIRHQGMCHTPPYGLIMYSGEKVTFKASICWSCASYKSDSLLLTNSQGFIHDSASAKKTLELLNAQLPYKNP